MDLGGLQRTTLSDFPGRVACAVFTSGCNLRCPYCHNPELLNGEPSLPEEDFFSFLTERADVLDGVVVSGGEPTLQADLPAFVRRIADRGLDVKLDTNGTRPEALRDVLDTGAIDYVAMDLKTRPGRYDELGADVGDAVTHSVELVRTSGINHEFRTTFDPGVVAPRDFERMFDLVDEGPLFVQSVETAGVLDPETVRETPADPLVSIRDAVGELPGCIGDRG
ncbi:anaerobic ribonucleoside-triphosphate reductase activating protein [Halorhabdus amylolytica]|uniref:anaerobic ribonucleoside-triphosphate reductase activating protein n=1 Tax=Halorhabdus amylolytica TaxID=2559573 RepID=UPI0010AB2ABA|nr:anaerobic ribonucleoside-triphosphate reductase activating protein [Halorhabdus amylolytica]